MDGLVIMRAGHYFIPNGNDGTCQGATVAHVGRNANGVDVVNLRVLQHDAEEVVRLDVVVLGIDAVPPLPQEIADLKSNLRATDTASFHFTTQCPWGR